jgi:hypothetical protein
LLIGQSRSFIARTVPVNARARALKIEPSQIGRRQIESFIIEIHLGTRFTQMNHEGKHT